MKEAKPQNPMMAVINYEPKKEEAGCLGLYATWDLGMVEVRPLLATTQAHVAKRETHDNADECDSYAVLKLLPFAKKLSYAANMLQRDTVNPESLEAMKKAILSDLVTEFYVYSRDKWMGDYSQRQLRESLQALLTLRQFDLSATFKKEQGKQFLGDILLQLEYIAKRIVSTADSLLFPWWRRRFMLSDICENAIKKLVNPHFQSKELSAMRKELETLHGKTELSDLFHKAMHPYSNVKFDEGVGIAAVVERTSLPLYLQRQSMFTESQYVFANDKEREAAIAVAESECQFDLPKP